jgi:hypothetical protein
MVVDYLAMSRVDFAIPDFCLLIPNVPGAGEGSPSLHCTIPTEGAPSLRFLQGWVKMMPAQLLSVLHYPFGCRRRTALRKVREGQGTRSCGGFCSLKARPTRPNTLVARQGVSNSEQSRPRTDIPATVKIAITILKQ